MLQVLVTIFLPVAFMVREERQDVVVQEDEQSVNEKVRPISTDLNRTKLKQDI